MASREGAGSLDTRRMSEVEEAIEAEVEPYVPRSFMLTGGCGFLGRHIVEVLLARGDKVRILDLQQTFEDDRVDFRIGDVRNYEHVRRACQDVDTVFHLASLTEPWSSYARFYEINVQGTQNVIRACREQSVKRLIYTSTGSVVMDGNDIKNGDESLEYPAKHLDNYSASKAEAERLVIRANGTTNDKGVTLLTCSLRPHAMFGSRDNHFIAQLIAKAREGDITHMVGDGQNLVDFTYVENAVHAHILAADKLLPDSPVGGQCYFITNGEPRKFWDFVCTILSETGCVGPTKSISFRVAYMFAYVMELLAWLLSPFIHIRPSITRHMVCTMACSHWFSHAKATRELGYRPIVSLKQGLEQTVAYFQQVVRRKPEVQLT